MFQVLEIISPGLIGIRGITQDGSSINFSLTNLQKDRNQQTLRPHQKTGPRPWKIQHLRSHRETGLKISHRPKGQNLAIQEYQPRTRYLLNLQSKEQAKILNGVQKRNLKVET